MTEKFKWAGVIVASLIVGGVAMAGINAAFFDDGNSTSVIERVSSPSTTGVQSSVQDVADLYEVVRPSVVKINTVETRGGNSLGSGVVIDDQGHILTNNHVVGTASQISVSFWDGTSVIAKLVGTDPGNDLAVIQVDVDDSKLKPAKLGDSTKIRVGELAIAVGNPFDIDGSVTEGIISGVGRTLLEGGGRPLRQLIQSDAAINPGNSGGGLFNGRGELLGITTAIENPSGDRVFVGIGYAVPVETARRFLPQMLAGERIEHPRMGVGLRDVTPDLAQSLGLGVDHGVMITNLEASSAGARAGLRGGTTRNSPGDVIVSIDGKATNSFEELATYIDSKKVGDKVSVKINRGGQEMTLEVTLEAWRVGNTA